MSHQVSESSQHTHSVIGYKGEPACLMVKQSQGLEGSVRLAGAKNAALVVMASLLLTRGKSLLRNVPASADVYNMVQLLQELGAEVHFDDVHNVVSVDTTHVYGYSVSADLMNKMRASVLVLGPLLATQGKAEIAFPGGCVIGDRPIDYHLKNFAKMGVTVTEHDGLLSASVDCLHNRNLLLEYPSVGATENILMAAVLTEGTTKIINAALEPEVFDLIDVLKKMGACVDIEVPATIKITGVKTLHSVDHAIIFDRLEAGALLLAGAITGGYVIVPEAPAHSMGLFLMKLQEMGHIILIGPQGTGVKIKATKKPKAVSIKTSPYPSFPTDLQAPMTAALVLSHGTSVVQETVFENRLMHARELVKMGAQIEVTYGSTAHIRGVEALYGTQVIASDIRASCALVLAGLAANGTTTITGIHHWKRGYQALEKKLQELGALIELFE